jgi:hypothetical protein
MFIELAPAMFRRILTTSWPGLSRPSTSYFLAKQDVDARHTAGHDVAMLCSALRTAVPYAKSLMLVLSSNTVISGALPEKPSSLQRATTWS